MSNWDNNNVAHTNLWGFERWKLGRKKDSFAESGGWPVNDLIGTVTGESAEMRLEKANAHARALDEVFSGFFHAKYEDGMTRDKALAILVTLLSDPNKVLKDLGDPISDAYLFLGEL